jgi:hypothetical protein
VRAETKLVDQIRLRANRFGLKRVLLLYAQEAKGSKFSSRGSSKRKQETVKTMGDFWAWSVFR